MHTTTNKTGKATIKVKRATAFPCEIPEALAVGLLDCAEDVGTILSIIVKLIGST